MNKYSNKIIAALALSLAAVLTPTAAPAVNLAPNELGDAAVSPFYTTRAGWQSLISLTNTSNAPVLALVRVRESHNNRSVLDFLVTLAGFDQFVGLLRTGANGLPVFVATDQPNANGLRTCTVPTTFSNFPGSNQPGASPEVALNPAGYGITPTGTTDDNYDGGAINNERLREGTIEVISLGHAAGNTTGATVGAAGVINIGNAIEQNDCASVQTALISGTNPTTQTRRILETARQFGEPINAVKFEQRLLNGGRGIEAAAPVTTWANFFDPGNGSGVAGGTGPFTDPDLVVPADNADCTIARSDLREGIAVWRQGGGNNSCNNLIAQAGVNNILEPSLDDAFPAVAIVLDDTSNTAQFLTPRRNQNADDFAGDFGSRGVDALSATLQRSAVINSFADGPRRQGNIRTDWIVSFPTKGFYVDRAGEPDTPSEGSVYTSNNDPSSHDNDLTFGQQFAITDGRLNSYLVFNDSGFVSVTSGISVPYPPFAESFGPQSYANGPNTGPIPANAGDGVSCDDVRFALYDRATQTRPQAQSAAELCHAVNVITFNGNSALGRNLDNDNPPANRLNIATSGLPDPNFGWMFLDLTNGGNGRPLVVDRTSVRNAQGDSSTEFGVGLMGLPTIGFSLQQRNFGSVSANYASSVSHSYLR